MRVIAVSTLKTYWERHPDAEQPLKSWKSEAEAAEWRSPADVKDKYRSASVLQQGRIVFNIAGNRHRLVVHIAFNTQIVFIKFIGTHLEYDKIDAQTVAHRTDRRRK